jgi:hypothetical protein
VFDEIVARVDARRKSKHRRAKSATYRLASRRGRKLDSCPSVHSRSSVKGHDPTAHRHR